MTRKENGRDMVDTPLPQVQPISQHGESPRVYCPEVAPLRLADGTPLYLEWIIEGDDDTLYRVPAEPGGWLRRSLYEGQPNKLKPASSRDANVITRLTCANPAGMADVTAAGYSFDYYHSYAP